MQDCDEHQGLRLCAPVSALFRATKRCGVFTGHATEKSAKESLQSIGGTDGANTNTPNLLNLKNKTTCDVHSAMFLSTFVCRRGVKKKCTSFMSFPLFYQIVPLELYLFRSPFLLDKDEELPAHPSLLLALGRCAFQLCWKRNKRRYTASAQELIVEPVRTERLLGLQNSFAPGLYRLYICKPSAVHHCGWGEQKQGCCFLLPGAGSL